MMRAARLLLCACLPTVLFAGTLSTTPVFRSASTGLIAFSGEDVAIRVAVVFADKDEAVVETVVNFIDTQGTIIKKHRAELHDDQPVVAELTRRDVADRGNLLVRVQVITKLPGTRDHRYPILATVQPLTPGGAGRFTLDVGGGECGCIGVACGTGEQDPGTTAGVHAMCLLDLPAAF
jgi:hypothetical protein